MKFFSFIKSLIIVVTLSFLYSCSSENMDVEESKAIFEKSNTAQKITICHKDGETLSVSVNALQAHLDHGDKIGPCGYTYVPDDNFEEALAQYDDIPNDNYVPTANIENVIGLNISDKSIMDLTGLQDFSELRSLNCSLNQISVLDFSGQTNMTYIRANDNLISELDVSRFASLEFLYVANNRLEKLVLSTDQNGALRRIQCQNNMLESLNMSNFKELERVRCENNYLSVLNLKNGFNDNIFRPNFRNNDPQLLITVDDPIKAEARLAPYDTWRKDASATYN